MKDYIKAFCARMQYSGHGLTIRTHVVEAAVAAYKKQVQQDRARGGPAV